MIQYEINTIFNVVEWDKRNKRYIVIFEDDMETDFIPLSAIITGGWLGDKREAVWLKSVKWDWQKRQWKCIYLKWGEEDA